MINFNATHTYVLPSYHAQHMFRAHLGAHTLRFSRAGGHTGSSGLWSAIPSAAATAGAHVVALKMVNYAYASLTVEAGLDGWIGIEHANATVLTADHPDAENTLDAPARVTPRRLATSWERGGLGLTVTLPPWSVVVVRLKMLQKHVQKKTRTRLACKRSACLRKLSRAA